MKHNICMVSDFFYPNTGGVEEHVFNLSQCLMSYGHKVIVITHSYGSRVGIRYMTKGLKVYYLPIKVFYNQCVLPTMIASLPVIRIILLREEITIIHGHSAFSTLAHEAMIIGRLMGLKTAFTDHSLFGFADTSAVITNKFLELSLADIHHCICVSHTGKENTVLRARVHHSRVSVIPNAVDTTIFVPDPSSRSREKVTVVIISRLVYRKGVDLMAQVIPEFCSNHPEVDVIIGGDGPKLWVLEEVRERACLQDRITILGNLPHDKVRDVLVQGHIFLNTSLTEAYCMAIVEAASCGLQIVSTKVGGIPEVLPPELIYLADPTASSLLENLERALKDLKDGRVVLPYDCHEKVKSFYNWMDVARRTENVYNKIICDKVNGIGQQLKRYLHTGVWPFLLVLTLCYLIIQFLEWLLPQCNIDLAKNFETSHVSKKKETDD